MAYIDTISNDRLSITFRLPRNDIIYSKRFDAAGCISRVVLDGKHQFCEPEMVVVGRPDTHGAGLVGEFKWDALGTEVKKDESFPKFGVGLLGQIEDNKPYSHIVHDLYDVEPFETQYEIGDKKAVFVQQSKEWNGIQAIIKRVYTIEDNKLFLNLTVSNTGSKDINMHEYEHNFVSIDHIPIGPGYHLYLPFDKKMNRFENCVHMYGRQDLPVPGVLSVSDNRLSWNKFMTDYEYAVLAGKEELADKDFFWTLEHDDSNAKLTFKVDKNPDLVVYWSIAQCICQELYIPFNLKPDETGTVHYEWIFED